MLYCIRCEKMNALIGELVCRECAKEEIKCAYCGEQENPKQFVVWVNGVRRVMWFCDNTCASYFQ